MINMLYLLKYFENKKKLVKLVKRRNVESFHLLNICRCELIHEEKIYKMNICSLLSTSSASVMPTSATQCEYRSTSAFSRPIKPFARQIKAPNRTMGLLEYRCRLVAKKDWYYGSLHR